MCVCVLNYQTAELNTHHHSNGVQNDEEGVPEMQEKMHAHTCKMINITLIFDNK